MAVTSEEKKAEMQAARDATIAERQFKRAKRVKVGDWSVGYFDEFNFAVENIASPEGSRKYFNTLEGAYTRLLDVLIKEKSAETTTIRGVLDAIKAAQFAILQAIKESEDE